ncbi:hypothetical protein [Companilactobacillus nantensis]|uniref:hypothetical protein n=1 Tax=Companilactobacillus nantensis TaxID=305793 RepID=UPI0007107C82|nr:hypothetical protein [Companilactobacillus nantensis]GEO64791.1 hypothetical protein LNA01_19740 [Companilactobacillus nantensis]
MFKVNHENKRPVPQTPPFLKKDKYYFKRDFEIRFIDHTKATVSNVIKTEIKDGAVIFICEDGIKLSPMHNKYNDVYPPANIAVFNLNRIECYQSVSCNLGINEDGE